MRNTHTPLPLVQKWEAMAPGCYAALDRCRRARDDGEMHWPDWCELPISAAGTYLVSAPDFTQQQAGILASELTACWTWRRSRIIYDYDPDLTAALAAQAQDMTDTDVLPSDLLIHLPHPCIYIRAPLREMFDGFWAWIEYDDRRPDTPELRLQFVSADSEQSMARVLHLVPRGTMADCLRDTWAALPPEVSAMADTLPLEATLLEREAIQLLLYLVSAGAETQARPSPRKPAKKGGSRSDPKPVKIIDVGLRIGAALRRGRTASPGGTPTGTDSAKRPHARRGHWHHYWTGPRDNRQLILKWTAPTFIHADQGRENNIIVFPVKPQKEDHHD